MALNKLFADSSKQLDIYARKGVILNETLTANDINGDPFDLTTYTAAMTVYKNDRTTSFITPTVTMNNGSIDIDETSGNMAIDSDNYYFEIVVSLPSSGGDEVWLTGNFIVNDGIFDSGTSVSSVTINTGAASNQVTLSLSTGSATVVNLLDTNITSIADNEILSYDSATSKWINEAPAVVVTDHGALTGLSDDDHPQYLKVALTASALADAATIDITGSSHTLTSALGRTFTISATGNDLTIELTLNATSATYTFPVGSLCVVEGVVSGDNTAALEGVSGDKYIIAIKKVDSNYYVAIKNFGQ